MSETDSQPPVCPVKAPDCSWLEELESLRQENQLLSEHAHVDNLTGLYNQRYFTSSIQIEMERTRRTGKPTSLIMLDLDRFKKLNDTWGHENGNKALKQTADLLHDSMRQLDIVCRYGGEEFIIILPATHLRQAVMVAERIRSSLDATPLVIDDQSIEVTASFGVDSLHASELMSAADFVHSADSYLYKAKEAGRNQVCHPDFDSDEGRTEVSDDERKALFS